MLSGSASRIACDKAAASPAGTTRSQAAISGRHASSNALGENNRQACAESQGYRGTLGACQVRRNQHIRGRKKTIHFLIGDVAILDAYIAFKAKLVDGFCVALLVLPKLARSYQEGCVSRLFFRIASASSRTCSPLYGRTMPKKSNTPRSGARPSFWRASDLEIGSPANPL